MSEKIPEPNRPPRQARERRRRRLRDTASAASLCTLLCVAPAAFASAPRALQPPPPNAFDRPAGQAAQTSPAQSGQQPRGQNPSEPAPTPYVRPRIVGPRPGQATPPPAAPAGEAPAAAQEVGEDEVVRVDSNLVIVPATVVDGRGRAVTDLKLADFELRIDGQVKPITELSRAETPVHIALLFDNSASLSAAREFERQAAIRFFGSVVRPIDRAAIYAISTDPVLSQPFTNDVGRLVRTIERFGRPEGATALFDAIRQASNYLRPIPGRKIVVIVSDGTDTVSDTNFEEALQHALHADCQVYVVMTRQLEDPNVRDTVSEQFMARLTEQTGGAIYVPRAVEELDSVFAQISLDLAQQYVLSYYPQEERQDKYFRFISLRVKTRPNLRVRARRGFYPGAAQNQALLPPPAASAPAGFGPESARTSDGSGAESTASPWSSTGERQGRAEAVSPAEAVALNRDAAFSRRVGPAGPDDDEGDRARVDANTSAPAATPAPLWTLKTTPRDAQPERPPATTPTPAQVFTPTPAPRPAAAPAKPPASGEVLNGKALRLPMPAYPAGAKSAGASGKVEVEVTIDVRGRVVSARPVSGHPLLQSAAVSAARQARFSPTILSGRPVEVTGTIFYNFALRED